MIEASAIVVSAGAGRALVRITQRPGGCGRCHEPGGCQSLHLTHALAPQRETFWVEDTLDVKEGESVRLLMHERTPVYAALLSYGLAVALMLVGAAVGAAVAGGDGAALLGGVSGVALAFLINRVVYRSRAWRNNLKISMRREDCRPCAGKADPLS